MSEGLPSRPGWGHWLPGPGPPGSALSSTCDNRPWVAGDSPSRLTHHLHGQSGVWGCSPGTHRLSPVTGAGGRSEQRWASNCGHNGAVAFPRARFQIESSHQRCGDTRELADVGARCQHTVRLYREATYPSLLLGHTHDITLAMVSWEHLPAGTNTHTCPNTQCEQQRIHPLSPTGPDTRTQTLVHTHTRLRTCRSLWLCTRCLSSTHRAWGHLDSVQLFTPPLCPLLGLPQGTQYPWTPLHPPP